MVDRLYRQLTLILLAHGCTFVRDGKGSHQIWLSPLSGRHFAVPTSIAKRHTANEILKQAGLAKAF